MANTSTIQPNANPMKLRIPLTAFFILAAVLLTAFLYNTFTPTVPSGQSLIGKPVPESVARFLASEDLSGESFVLLSDAYVEQCNERYTEFNNLIAKLQKNGTQIRMLHASRHGMPVKSYDDSITFNRGAPNHIITADISIIYDHSIIRRLPKPSVIILKNGVVSDVLVGQEFEDWGRK